MVKKNDKDLIVGLDIGTSKVVAIVAEPALNGGSGGNVLEVIGIGHHPSHGMKRGVVVNIESMAQAIQRAVAEAGFMASCHINSVYVGIAGSHISGLNSGATVAIRDMEVMQEDVDRVLDAAKAVAFPGDQRLLHVMPQEYIIDGQGGIREPVGMSGVRLEANVHLITGAVSAAQNITKCVERCNLAIDGIVLEQIASSYSVLEYDEKELGVCLVDIGGGTTDIAVFVNGAIRHTAVIPIAGRQVTNDIAHILRTPVKHAEDIKMNYACALTRLVGENETIDVPSFGDRPPRILQRQTLAKVVESRYEELLQFIKKDLQRSGFEEMLAAGVVLTGGSAKMEGAVDLAEEIFHLPVRLGSPQYVGGLADMIRNPIYATGVGLLLYGNKNDQLQFDEGPDSSFSAMWARMKSWFQGNYT